MATGYFDVTNTNYGMTIRTHYEEVNGTISITNIQLQSTKYGGGTNYAWFPGGTIKIGDQTVLTMSYNNPATHAFSIYGVSEDWSDIYNISSGVAIDDLPSVTVGAPSVVISVDIELYRDSSTGKPTLSGSTTIEVSTGFVYIDNGSGYEAYMVYIDNGTSWDRYIPYIDNGTSWDMCS